MDEKEYENLILGSLLDAHIKENCLKRRNFNKIIAYVLEQKALEEMKEQQIRALSYEALCRKLAESDSFSPPPFPVPRLSREVGIHPGLESFRRSSSR